MIASRLLLPVVKSAVYQRVRSWAPRTRTRNCGLRVWSECAGRSGASPLSSGFASQCCPSFPDVARSFTGMRRGWHSLPRCYRR